MNTGLKETKAQTSQRISDYKTPVVETSQRDTPDKRTLYKTARATLGCARFKRDDFVAVRYYGQGPSGTHWFLASKSIEGLFSREAVAYPEHHLTDFVL